MKKDPNFLKRYREQLFQAAYKARLEGAKLDIDGKAKPAIPATPPAPTEEKEPAPGPLEVFHTAGAIRGMQLTPARNAYFVLLAPGYFGFLRQCGKPMATTRHLFDCYKCPPGAKTVAEGMADKPIASMFTRPFVFHSLDSAKSAVRACLLEIAS